MLSTGLEGACFDWTHQQESTAGAARAAPLRVVAAGECMLELARQDALWRLGAAGDSYNTALYLRAAGRRRPLLHGPWPGSIQRRNAAILGAGGPRYLTGAAGSGAAAGALRNPHGRPRRAQFPLLAPAVPRRGSCSVCPASMRHCRPQPRRDLLYLTGITLSLFDATERRRWVELATAGAPPGRAGGLRSELPAEGLGQCRRGPGGHGIHGTAHQHPADHQ